MAYSLFWLADVLRSAGCLVMEDADVVGDWQHRGHGDFGSPKGVLLHDTAGRPPPGDHPSLATCIHGRPDLAGPLCNLYLSRSGVFFPIAAGKGWHAGAGNWQGVRDGNAHLIGIEMENDGIDEPWQPAIMQAALNGVSALLKHIGAPALMCAGHKEYALPKGRKIDPDFDLDAFRAALSI